MKTLLITTLIFCSQFSIGQETILSDSIQERIQLFNDSITRIIEQYEADSIDFIAIRSSVRHGHNCRFLVREDTCTSMFIMSYDPERFISYSHVANVTTRNPGDGRRFCEKQLDRDYYGLTHHKDYFSKEKPDYSQYDPTKIIFYGSINGRYMFEIVEKDYFSTHHTGMFYATFRARF